MPDLLTKVGLSPDDLSQDIRLTRHHVAAFPEPTDVDDSPLELRRISPLSGNLAD